MRKIYTYILYFIFIVCSSCNESESVTLIDLTNNVTDSICTVSEITDSIVHYPLTTNKKPQAQQLNVMLKNKFLLENLKVNYTVT